VTGEFGCIHGRRRLAEVAAAAAAAVLLAAPHSGRPEPAAEDGRRYAAIVERPLFRADRRPPRDGAAAERATARVSAAASEEDDPPFVFVGTLRRDGMLLALVAPGEGDGKTVIAVEPSQEIMGWQVQRIEKDRLVVENERYVVEFRIFD